MAAVEKSATFLRSSFGAQPLATRRNAPSYGFGSAPRDQNKQWISAAHSKALTGMGSPGPAVYSVHGGVGRQLNSRLTSAPAFGFGSAARFGYESPSRPTTAAGGAERPFTDRMSSVPGPGAYSPPSTVGGQGDPRYAHAASYGFGSADRDKAGRVYLSPAHARLSAGRDTPGPATASDGASMSAMGRQAVSTHPSGPSYGFGSAGGRGEVKSNGMPGPDRYDVTSSPTAAQHSSRAASPRRITFGGGRNAQDRRYMSSAHAKLAFAGRESPGPVYSPQLRASTPAFGFGKAQRFDAPVSPRMTPTPGPGHYNA